MAWVTSVIEQLPKAIVFGFLLFWIVSRNMTLGVRAGITIGTGLLAAMMLGRALDRFGLPAWVFSLTLVVSLFIVWLVTWTSVFN